MKNSCHLCEGDIIQDVGQDSYTLQKCNHCGAEYCFDGDGLAILDTSWVKKKLQFSELRSISDLLDRLSAESEIKHTITIGLGGIFFLITERDLPDEVAGEAPQGKMCQSMNLEELQDWASVQSIP